MQNRPECRIGSRQYCLHVLLSGAGDELREREIDIVGHQIRCRKMRPHHAGIRLIGCRADEGHAAPEQPGVGDNLQYASEDQRWTGHTRVLEKRDRVPHLSCLLGSSPDALGVRLRSGACSRTQEALSACPAVLLDGVQIRPSVHHFCRDGARPCVLQGKALRKVRVQRHHIQGYRAHACTIHTIENMCIAAAVLAATLPRCVKQLGRALQASGPAVRPPRPAWRQPRPAASPGSAGCPGGAATRSSPRPRACPPPA